jgi:hypothetical protein
MASNKDNDKNSKVLGTGSFGVVVHPSLKNKNNNKSGINRKKYITKFFYRKENYNKLQTKKKNIEKGMGNHEGSYYNGYERKFIFGDLDERIRNKIQNEYEASLNNDNNEDKKIEIPYNKELYAIRMPYLGKSIDKISRDDIINIKKCSIYNILSECNKLFNITAKLAKEGYIHGDMESRNILISIRDNNCKFYIIDYDRFNTYDKYKEEYKKELEQNIYLLYGPPESIILLMDKDNHLETIDNRIGWYAWQRIYYYHNRPYKTKEEFIPIIKGLVDKFRENNKKVKLKYFDNFILGLNLLDFFRKVYDIDKIRCEESNEIKALCEFRDEVLYPMTSLDVENRIDPDEVLKRMKIVLCIIKNNSSCSIQGGKRKITHKRRK